MLLSRLGAGYADALGEHRLVLRRVWAAHGGVEMGTKGDSFFVAFPTAPAAVAAAAQAQRDLAGHAWPGGDQVRVRIGIHTGSPLIRDGEYVGMDVHRAARVAGAAHGGQVVVSRETADLARAHLPDGVRLTYLGEYRLKDLPAPERLSQVRVAGLQEEFPPLKALGASSRLPVPPTPLVGRDGELAELAALLASPEVRLVTLTGPGGSGKTRLAVGLAQRLTRLFADGVYFVPLAAVDTAEVMWTSIAEALDVPPEGRIPPGLFAHVAHRSALFVLDNLEQLVGADAVVAELLAQVPHAVVIATSRRSLHVSAEHEHPVPPLELPSSDDTDEVQRSGAVQLFVQQARKVQPSFRLSASNIADVAALCRRLDGLPLAIELAAARTKLLSAHALLVRLGQALDITAGGRVPNRQKTLRETITWSHDLLTLDQQVFFRQLGVFAGGADLGAITAVTMSLGGAQDGSTDPLNLVWQLVDASLVTATESPDGEPRIGMLQTIRTYAHDCLTASGELEVIRRRHAHHYVALAEGLSAQLHGPHYRETRIRFETEHDNLREALGWTLQSDEPHQGSDPNDVNLGLRLCAALQGFWFVSGYIGEGRRWLQRAVEEGAGRDHPVLARCLQVLATSTRMTADLVSAQEYAKASVQMWRRLDDTSGLAMALITLAFTEADNGRVADARPLYDEALSTARNSGDKGQLRSVLGSVAYFTASERDYKTTLALETEALDIARELGDPSAVLFQQHNIACTLRQMGLIEEALEHMRSLIPQSLDLDEPSDLIVLAEDYAAILAEVGEVQAAVRLFGAADASRERLGIVRNPMQDAEIAAPLAKTRATLSTHEWNHAYEEGLSSTIEVLLTREAAGH